MWLHYVFFVYGESQVIVGGGWGRGCSCLGTDISSICHCVLCVQLGIYAWLVSGSLALCAVCLARILLGLGVASEQLSMFNNKMLSCLH